MLRSKTNPIAEACGHYEIFLRVAPTKFTFLISDVQARLSLPARPLVPPSQPPLREARRRQSSSANRMKTPVGPGLPRPKLQDGRL